MTQVHTAIRGRRRTHGALTPIASGYQAGDLAVCTQASRSGYEGTADGTWTALSGAATTVGECVTQVWFKYMSGPTDSLFVGGGIYSHEATYVYRGAAPASAVTFTRGSAGEGTITGASIPSLTTPVNNCYVMCFWAHQRSTTPRDMVMPSPFSTDGYISGGDRPHFMYGRALYGTAGATGSKGVGFASETSASLTGYLICVRPT